MKQQLAILDKHHSTLNDVMVKGELHGFDEQSLGFRCSRVNAMLRFVTAATEGMNAATHALGAWTLKALREHFRLSEAASRPEQFVSTHCLLIRASMKHETKDKDLEGEAGTQEEEKRPQRKRKNTNTEEPESKKAAKSKAAPKKSKK